MSLNSKIKILALYILNDELIRDEESLYFTLEIYGLDAVISDAVDRYYKNLRLKILKSYINANEQLPPLSQFYLIRTFRIDESNGKRVILIWMFNKKLEVRNEKIDDVPGFDKLLKGAKNLSTRISDVSDRYKLKMAEIKNLILLIAKNSGYDK